jgi:hypothetical protein
MLRARDVPTHTAAWQSVRHRNAVPSLKFMLRSKLYALQHKPKHNMMDYEAGRVTSPSMIELVGLSLQ